MTRPALPKARQAAKSAKPRKPVTSDDVDSYLERLDHPLRTELMALRAFVMKTEPGLREHIKWNAPSYQFEGDDRLTFNLFARDAIRLVFHCGAKTHKKVTGSRLIEDTTGRLTFATNNRAVAHFGSMAEVSAARKDLATLIKAWLAASI